VESLEHTLVRLGYKIISSNTAIIGRKNNKEIIISNDDNGYDMYFYMQSEQRIHISSPNIEPLFDVLDGGSILIDNWLC
jgi:hypothetical protein